MKALAATSAVAARGIEIALVAIFALYLAVIVAQVGLRTSFNDSLFWSEEFIRFALVWSVMLGASVATHRRSHIRVDLVDELLPERFKRPLHLVNTVLLLGFAVLMIWSGLQLVERTEGMTSSTLGLAMPMVYAVIPLSAAFEIVFLVTQLALLLSPIPAAEPAPDDGDVRVDTSL